MSIKNTQIEDKAKKLAAEEPSDPGAGNGVWYVDTVSGQTEGFFKDSTGAAVQVTKQGGLNVPPFAYNLTVKDEGTSVDTNVNELNFVGTGVSATQTAAGKINVNVSAGEANTGSNVGTGQGHVFKQKSGVDFQYRTISAGANVSVVESANEITISTASPSGEVNTASNVGPGNGLFKQKSGVDLEFRSIVAGSNVNITSDANTITINSSGGGGTNLSVKDEGTVVDSAVSGIDFVGAGVTTTQTSSGQVQVSIPGTTALTVKDEGTNVTTSATTLNFTGAGVSATLSSPGVVAVAISGSGTNISVKDEGTTVESALTSLNFVGSGVTATSSSGTATITIPGSSGEANTASNVGAGSGLFKQKSGVDLQFKSLVAGSNVTLTPGTDTITIAASGGGSGTDTQTVRFASNKIMVRASGSTAALAGMTATKSFATASTCTVTLSNMSGIVVHSVLVRFTAAETAGRTNVELVYPEPFGATDLYQSVRPMASRLNAADAASSMTANAANSSGTMTITCTGYTAGQDYGAIFSF